MLSIDPRMEQFWDIQAKLSDRPDIYRTRAILDLDYLMTLAERI